jgi:ankyrin repeat protein
MNRYLFALAGLLISVSFSACAMTLPKAAETGNSSEVQRLIYQAAPVDERGGSMDETALTIAARHGNLGIVKTLLKAGADINARTKYGDTPLTAATCFCHANVAEYLIERGADVNVKNDGYGSTPLMLASECNDVEIVKALINKGANVNEKNKKGANALTAATIKGHKEVVRVLLDAGASAEETWGRGGTSTLYEAAQQGNDAIVNS